METISENNTYTIIEIPDIINNNYDSNKVVLIDSRILLSSENDLQPVCVSANSSSNSTKEYNSNNKIQKQTMNVSKRKLCYETEFKPTKPLKQSSMNGFIRYGKKQLVVDQQIMIGPKEFKNQLNDTSDITVPLDLAPRSRQAMQRLLNGINKLFAYPAHNICNPELMQRYIANCTSKDQPNVETITDMELLPLGFNKSGAASENTSNNIFVENIESKKYNKFINKTRKRKCVKRKQTENNEVIADQFVNDHQYFKEEKLDEVIIERSEINSVIKLEEMDVKNVFNNDDVYTIKSENQNEQIVFVQRLGDNISLSQKNFQALLAAANSNEENQIVAICNSSDLSESNGYFVVQKEFVT